MAEHQEDGCRTPVETGGGTSVGPLPGGGTCHIGLVACPKTCNLMESRPRFSRGGAGGAYGVNYHLSPGIYIRLRLGVPHQKAEGIARRNYENEKNALKQEC